MSWRQRSLHEQLTQLLMDNGCTVNKLAIDELLKFISKRDENVYTALTSEIDAVKTSLDFETGYRDGKGASDEANRNNTSPKV